MVKAQELRMGNLVMNKLFPHRLVDCLDIRDQFEDRLNHPYEGIPITNEWLERLGFSSTTEASFSTGAKVNFKVYKKNPEGVPTISLTYNEIQDQWWFGSPLPKQPQFIHELQNLYYSLFGHELVPKDSL